MKPFALTLTPVLMGVAVLGTVVLAAGCGDSAEPNSSPASVAVQPTNKSVSSTSPRGFNQNSTAADGIRALEAEGYNVEINWGGGRTDLNLALCRMGSVDGLRGSGAVTPGTSVYVTVIC